ncbi:hypothetical protein [Kribbella deserti]|uniref:AbiEi antitoxin C-terminal domain-containing protein n=1 Tax=Kribbella deserti TaxID=1926257 RepID=A0ABV6QQN4_9ACTN
MASELFQQLTSVAAGQSGLVTGAQAARTGLGKAELERLSSGGLLFELDWDVHQLTSSPLAPRFAYPYAAWLALAPDKFASERTRGDAVLSQGSAARLHGLGAVGAPVMTFLAPIQRFGRLPRAVEVNVDKLAPPDVMVLGGVTVTTPHRTIVDLVRSHTDHGEVRGAITDAVLRDAVDLARLYDDLVPLADHHEFPAEGPEFAGYFLPEVDPASLSPRNRRALTAVVLADRVDETERALAAALAKVPGGDRADAQTVRTLAADIVGRSEQV